MNPQAPFQAVVVEDDVSVSDLLTRLLGRANFQVQTFASGEEARMFLERNADSVDVVITDVNLPDLSGIGLLEYVRKDWPTLPIVVMTGAPTIQAAVDAMRKGAYDYLEKPFPIPEIVVPTIARAADHRRLGRRSAHLEHQLQRVTRVPGLIAEAPAMRAVLQLLDAVAATDATALVLGESGTGKELVARGIHDRGARKAGPFIALNCSALTDTLLESELFGYVKGAFTGAATDRQGLFEEAAGGTLFLDEIGDVAPATQVKLLRVLQDGEIRRVGSNQVRKVDARIIAATNRDLQAAMREGTFREDLFFRLNVVTITIPPLRERLQDMPALVQHFLGKYAERYKKTGLSIHPSTLDVLCKYRWPGNIRELENAIQRALVVTQGDLLMPSGLSNEILGVTATEAIEPVNETARAPFSAARDEAIADFEKRYFTAVLSESKGSLAAAAHISQMDKSNLRRMVLRNGIDPTSFRDKS